MAYNPILSARVPRSAAWWLPRSLPAMEITLGERWIFSAGFNVNRDLANTVRVDVEVQDLRYLLERRARVAILSHQMSSVSGTAEDLDFVADYLSSVLGIPVRYIPTNDDEMAVASANELVPGEVVVFGNTRKHPGEVANDARLAEKFAALGDKVAIAGFSKAHRAHASNVGVLRYRPGVLCGSVVRELGNLEPFARTEGEPTLAVIGGAKDEKVGLGLLELGRKYRTVIPGGITLNVILLARGHNIGSSVVGTWGSPKCLARVREFLKAESRAHVLLPTTVMTARNVDGAWIDPDIQEVSKPVPDGRAIVDFIPSSEMSDVLAEAAERGRTVVAGPPSLTRAGFRMASDCVVKGVGKGGGAVIWLGGDTVSEMRPLGTISSGGGAALEFLSFGTTRVLETLEPGWQWG